MLFETSCTFFALLVKTVSRQEPKNIRFCISMLLLTPSGVILRSFGAQLRKSKYSAPLGPRGARWALAPRFAFTCCAEKSSMFLFVSVASTFGALRRNANLSYAALLFVLACCADIQAVMFWLQPT